MAAPPSRLLVITGSRDLGDRELVRATLSEHTVRGARLMHGANGVVPHLAVRYDPYPPVSADALADSVWRTWNRHSVHLAELFPAHWTAPCRPSCRPGHRRQWRGGESICPAAGPYRNQDMVNAATVAMRAGWEVRVLAFPVGVSRGTRDCMRRAAAAGLRVLVIPVPGREHLSVRETRKIKPPRVPPGE